MFVLFCTSAVHGSCALDTLCSFLFSSFLPPPAGVRVCVRAPVTPTPNDLTIDSWYLWPWERNRLVSASSRLATAQVPPHVERSTSRRGNRSRECRGHCASSVALPHTLFKALGQTV